MDLCVELCKAGPSVLWKSERTRDAQRNGPIKRLLGAHHCPFPFLSVHTLRLHILVTLEVSQSHVPSSGQYNRVIYTMDWLGPYCVSSPFTSQT